jgi:hypothetical protein
VLSAELSLDIPEHLRPKARYLKPDPLPTIDAVPLETDKLKPTKTEW